jgi:Transcriptional regulatory protein, C terminal
MSSAIDAAGLLREPAGWVSSAESLPGTRGTLLTVVPGNNGRSVMAIVGYLLPSPFPRGSSPGPLAGLTVDRSQHRVLVNGLDIQLLFQEFELLEFLTAHPHRALTREEILAGAWGGRQQEAPTRTVDVHIHRLRRKLGPEYARSLVTVRRVGYLYRPHVPRAS